jgi:hypothetical protein
MDLERRACPIVLMTRQQPRAATSAGGLLRRRQSRFPYANARYGKPINGLKQIVARQELSKHLAGAIIDPD